MTDTIKQMSGNSWWTVDRVTVFARSLAIFECAMFVFFAAGTHGLIVPLDGPTTTDFVSFYAAGTLTDAGHAGSVYERFAHHAAEQQATAPGIAYNYFYYPPVYLLLCGLLGVFPYLLAFCLFQAMTLLPCLIAARSILPQTRLVVFLAFPAVFWTMGTGQNAFLSAGLFAFATILIDRRPWLAGLLLGCLCYKPHFGLLIPIALIAGAHGRAFAGAALSVVGLIGLSVLLFGAETWQAFFTAAAAAQPIYATNMIDMSGLTSPFGAAISLGASANAGFLAQGLASIAVMAAVAVVWRSGASLPVRAAVLIAGTPLAVPIVMFYDLMLDGAAMLWLMRAARDRGCPAWHRPVLAVLFLLPILSGNLGGGTNLLLPPITALGCFVLALSQFRHERGGQAAGAGLTSAAISAGS